MSLLVKARQALHSGQPEQALSDYYAFKQRYPELSALVDVNIALIEKKLSNNHERPYKTPSLDKIIVYSCNFGAYENVKDPLFIDPTVDYILFTDNKNIRSNTWKVQVINDDLLDARRCSRLPKIMPHKYLPEHDISVYLDSSLELKTGNIRQMVADCMQDNEIAFYKHYSRNCVYDEIDFVMSFADRQVYDKELCIRAKQKYQDINYPKGNGLFENAFIFRKNTKPIQELSELWWNEYITGTERDQFTLMYCLHQLKIEPHSINIGCQFRDNPFVNFYKHIYKPSAAIPDMRRKFSTKKAVPIEIKNSNDTSKNGTINWIIGGDDNSGWAYENNANRFISEISEYDHFMYSNAPSDVALYFDILLFDRMRVEAPQNIVRIGGPRPIKRLCGEDSQKLKKVLSNFHSVICLNDELRENLSLVHPNVHMIPNGLDLDKFNPDKKIRSDNSPFTIGFAGSVKSSEEREVKGLDYAIEAARIANVNLLNIGRGKNQTQIPHNRMIEDFYSKIDVLVHPVGPGREGSSNVIMEALALGIPVITTEHAGYHSEKLEDLKNVLFCSRNAQDIADKILYLVEDKGLCGKLSAEGRKFVVQHHDIRDISIKYKHLIDSAVSYNKAKQKISFVPFWLPVSDFATGRLRCAYIANMLNDESMRSAKLGYDPKADVVIISQLASDELFQQIVADPHQFVIYDICDRYYADNRIVGGVHAQQRFTELAERANLIIVSTIELKKDLYNLKINKPIVHIPDGIDFKFAPTKKNNFPVKTVGWFGNPGRGNFESAVWLLEAALRLNKSLRLITKRKSLKQYPSLYPYAKEWQHTTFISELQKCDVVIVTHAKDEQNKSPNRLLTAVSKGIPVIVSSSQSCEKILQEAGLEWAIVTNEEELNSACNLLSDPVVRNMYFKLVTPVIEKTYGDMAIKKYYENLLNYHVYEPSSSTKKVLFVSHNLSIGEGAPTSLYQTVVGLKNAFNIQPTIFCPMTGEFKELYEKEGVKVRNYTKIVSKDSLKPLNANFEKAKIDFQLFIREEEFDMVICNTAKMLPYADFAIELGIPAISIIRESSDEHIDLTFSKNNNIIDAAKRGLSNVKEVIFVSDVTRQLWKTRQFLPRTKVIHNGIITDSWSHLNVASKSELRRKLCLPINKQIILSVGTINARKAQIDIINAYQMLSERSVESSYLVLVGARESAYLTLLKQEILKLPKNVQDNILLVPETDNVAEWYKAADIFAFSSHNESYPRVIIEALYFGLRIISSRVFGVAEQLGNNKKASIYEIGDVPSLAAAMHDQLSNAYDNAHNMEYFYSLTTYHEMLNKYFVQISKNLN